MPEITGRSTSSNEEAAMSGDCHECVCKEPQTPGVVHRTDGPCYVEEGRGSSEDGVVVYVVPAEDEQDWEDRLRPPDVTAPARTPS